MHLFLDYDENLSYLCFERVWKQVDRLAMVRSLELLASSEGLEPDEIRLFLLLLANCDDSGEGRTGCRQLGLVFGHWRSLRRVRRALRRLADLGLIRFETVPGGRGEEKGFVLSYSIPGAKRCESEPVA